MSVVIVSLDEFYREYPEFNTEAYQNICPICFRRAKCRIGIKNTCFLKDCKRIEIIYLLTAHLSVLSLRAQSGQGGAQGSGQVASASVGEVSVSYVQIPGLDSWSYWLSSTPYGLELLALLDSLSAMGFYFGGTLERVF